MRTKDLAKTALRALTANWSRSMLTILGIVIGITSIMLVMSLGAGAQALILGQIEGLGSKTIVVIPGREPTGPSDSAQIFSDSLKEHDLESIMDRGQVPTAALVMPIVFGGQPGVYGGETYRLTIFGGSEKMSDMFDLHPENGIFFSSEDVRARASVVVIGSKVKKELFGDAGAVGEHIRIKGQNLRVIGVLPTQGQSSFINFDDAAIVPYTTAQQYILGIKYFHRLFVQADSDTDLDRTVKDIQRTLRQNHGITDTTKDDFYVTTQADLANRLSSITSVLTIFLAAVAAISLFVGGIGIMNIMLVSVTERTREIGLRKALGATDRNILNQFLTESVFLTSAGGIIGILLGSFLSFIISLILTRVVALGWTFVFPFSAAAIGVLVAFTVGVVFGLYPARKAARKSPIEALRYE